MLFSTLHHTTTLSKNMENKNVAWQTVALPFKYFSK